MHLEELLQVHNVSSIILQVISPGDGKLSVKACRQGGTMQQQQYSGREACLPSLSTSTCLGNLILEEQRVELAVVSRLGWAQLGVSRPACQAAWST